MWRAAVTVWFMGCVAITPLAAEDIPLAARRFRVDNDVQRKELLQRDRSDLAANELFVKRLKAGRVDVKQAEPIMLPAHPRQPLTYKSKEIKALRIATAEAALKDRKEALEKAKRGEPTLIPNLRSPFETGQIGRLEKRDVTVVQVIGPSAFVGEWLCTAADGSTSKILSCFQAHDRGNLADHQVVFFTDIEDVFQVAGTMQTTDPSGAAVTMQVLVRLAPDRVAQLLSEAKLE